MVRTKSVATSNTTDIIPSIKEFDVKHSFDSPIILNGSMAAEDFDVWLITTPVKFPNSGLEDIPLVEHQSSLRIKSEAEDGITKSYTCVSRNEAASSTSSVFIPSAHEATTFNTKKINGHIQIKRNIEKLKPNLSHCIKRPSPPTISKNLHERLKLIGCDTVLSIQNLHRVEEVKLKRKHSSSKRKNMKKKKY